LCDGACKVSRLNRLRKVKLKARFKRSPSILVGAVRAEGHRQKLTRRTTSDGSYQFAPILMRHTQIADE
jgi:hypothetical protein